MNNIINKLRTSYGNLSNRLIEEYDRRQYMRFYKGKLIDNEAKVSLATACFYMGQGFGYIRGLVVGLYTKVGQLRTVRRNRLK
jgi:hypothetical protein